MTPNRSRRGFIFLLIFILALAAAVFFALQLRRQRASQLANYLAADKGYGVTIDLTRYDEAVLADTLTSLRAKGLIWLRQPVSWANVEPATGQFDWEQLDRVLAAIARENEQTVDKKYNFKLIAVLQTTPTWARPDNTPLTSPPIEVSDFGNFARALATRYGQQIDYYQIWHEPNLSANWGNTFVDPAAYADLLRDAALNIRAVDPEAAILAAALAPTLENGPLNLNDIDYLDQLYQAQADRWFDIVAAQPYGFDSEPGDPAQSDSLNFRRIELLRQVMLNHDAAETPIWATAFGWNALPANWDGQSSPWKSDRVATQAERAAKAIEQARRDWPWLGPMLAIRWDAAGLAEDDPARGFALLETPSILEVIQNAAAISTVATPGRYPADHPGGQYSPGWRFALAQADISRDEPRALTIPFEGTRLDLTVNRGPYRGYLWVTTDGQPANALPQDGQGHSYVVLYDPLRQSETVTLAENLAPGRHEAIIEAEGGWGQWAIAGWVVRNDSPNRLTQIGLAVAGLISLFSGLGLLRQFLYTPVVVIKAIWAWSEIVTALYAILREPGHLVVTFALALLVYLAPGLVALFLLPLLALAILLRPDLGLALIAFSLSFFQAPKQLPIGAFSPVEFLLMLTVVGFIFRGFLAFARGIFTRNESSPQLSTLRRSSGQVINYQLPLTHTDLAALALLILALLATFAADNFGVSMREWRVVVLGSVIFYFLVRLGADFGSPELSQPPPQRWVWRLVDAFIAGATLQALIALYLYFFTNQSITAEGVHRALGLAYGSPNNLSLFLDRAWPILLAVALLPGERLRRWLYGLGFTIVSLALYLTFSKGALLVALPACAVAMALLYTLHDRQRRWRRALAIVGGGLVILLLALSPLSQTERFRTTFDFSQGSTGFFRLKLWQASLSMLRDHWPLGVGLDNFLYQYRTRYILPAAWQEPNLSHPHNLILDFGTRLGIGGIAILLWLQVAFWRNAWQLYRTSFSPLILGLMGSMIVFLSHGLVDNSYFLVDLAFVFFLLVGIAQRLMEQSNISRPKTPFRRLER